MSPLPRQQRIQRAASRLCVEHLQELRDFGTPPVVQEALTLTMRVIAGRADATWHDARAIWTRGGFTRGLHRFIALVQDYARSPEPAAGQEWEDDVLTFVVGPGCEERRRVLSPEQQGAGAALFDFLFAMAS